MQKERKWAAGLLAVMLAALCLALLTEDKRNERREVAYPAFMAMAKEGSVEKVLLEDAGLWQATLKNGEEILTPNPRTPDAKAALLEMGIHVEEKEKVHVAPLLVMGMLLFLMLRQQKGSGMEKMMHTDSGGKGEKITFEDLVIGEETLSGMQDLVHYLNAPERYEKMGARPPRGVLLYGPPGTGKTMLAKALAGETGKPFFAVSGSDFVQVYVGVGAGRIRSLFRKARKTGGGVIFIDEIDAIGKTRDQGNDEREQTLNALLTEMNGFSGKDGVIVLAATNRMDTLDGALLREGRFDRHIEVGLPGKEERRRILKIHSRNKPLEEQVSLAAWAEKTALFSGAQLESMMNEAAIRAVREGKEKIGEAHMEAAFRFQTAGDEKAMAANEREKWMIACHEAGHALLTHLLLPQSRLTHLTILPSNKGAAGYSLSVQEDRLLYTRQELMHHMAVALGGRAAEEEVFGKMQVTNGAASDLKKAKAMAEEMAAWQMSDEEDEQKAGRALMQEGYALAMEKVRHNRPRLLRLARALMEKETLRGEEIVQFMA